MSIATDENRYPTLTASGKKMLDFMREHPNAPVFRNQSGNRLTAEDLAELIIHDKHVGSTRVRNDGANWLQSFIAQTYANVPYYRDLGSAPSNLKDVPTVSRKDFSSDIAQFVPDSVSVERMMHFQTSGTTGHPLLVPSHPQVAGRYLSYHKRALERFGVKPRNGTGEVGVILLGFQKKCFTYVSVTPQMNESGLAKINLHPNDWNDPNDRAAYLDGMASEIIAGDPIPFAELLKLPMTHQPKALLSVAMMLTDGLRDELERKFDCPVLDIYSMNEVGPIGVFDPKIGAHVLLQDSLVVETLDENGVQTAPGVRGEITVTGGFNFCLPLLRYRTGDYGVVSARGGHPIIEGLQGRRAVRFRTSAHEWLNNVDVSHALTELPLSQFGLHQRRDGSLIFYASVKTPKTTSKATEILAKLFGGLPIDVEMIGAEDKALQYTTDLEPPL